MDPAWTNRSGAVSLPQSIYGYLGVAMATVGGVQGELGGGLIGGREALYSHPNQSDSRSLKTQRAEQ